MGIILEEIRNIGYYHFVERGKRSFHVQTEVLGVETIEIKTTIMEGGVILDAAVQNHTAKDGDIDRMKDIIESQHKMVLLDVRQGKYD